MKGLKWIGYGFAGLLVLVAVAATAVTLASNRKLARQFVVPAAAAEIPSDAAAVRLGEHLTKVRGCRDCHGADLGGAKVIDDGAMGKIYGTNLTRGRGGLPATWRDEDFVRAIRHGVAPDGRGLFLMPSHEYSSLTTEDFGAIVAYIKSVPPVDRDRVAIQLGPVARVLTTVGKIQLAAEQINHANVKPAVVIPGVTAEYGRYLANGCIGCHGPNLSGGKIDIGPPDWPLAANLTPHASAGVSKWGEADFQRAMRERRRPDGSEVNPVMPAVFGQMTDVELKALWAYLRTLRPFPTGER